MCHNLNVYSLKRCESLVKFFCGASFGFCVDVTSGFELITYPLRRAAHTQLVSHISLASPEIFFCVCSRYPRRVAVVYRIAT